MFSVIVALSQWKYNNVIARKALARRSNLKNLKIYGFFSRHFAAQELQEVLRLFMYKAVLPNLLIFVLLGFLKDAVVLTEEFLIFAHKLRLSEEKHLS